MPSYTCPTPAVLAVRHASTGKGVDLTCVRSAVRPLAPPYLRPTSFPHRVDHIDGPVVRGREDVTIRTSVSNGCWRLAGDSERDTKGPCHHWFGDGLHAMPKPE
ncbi:hypothetical protein B296_00051789 [Ensete ventricosum]|uniref:Uncharacterized protein n=1 Tax=Ensete ventricosum TaxID=4639 RepID=A0A426YFA1_ENSVE|nr:hypothetical protein B296_00051789 [Ensete ventricosum]